MDPLVGLSSATGPDAVGHGRTIRPVTDVLLLRHGQSTWNAEGRWQGHADAPLSALGEQQAHDAVEHLRAEGLTVVVASDLERARRTAQIIAAGLGLPPPTLEPDLRERDVGVFTGLTRDEITQRWPEAFHPESGHVVLPPEGETDDHVLARVIPALVRLAADHQGERVLVVTHGGVVRTLERRLELRMPAAIPNVGGRWFHVDGDTITGGELVVTADADHATVPRSL